VTLEEQREAEQRAAAINELRKSLAGHEMNATKVRDRIRELEDADTLARLGSKRVSEMSTREKSELVALVGPEKFAQMVSQEHRK
jgi:predicted RNase H-like nuclease (RuvC/YqgF family)